MIRHWAVDLVTDTPVNLETALGADDSHLTIRRAWFKLGHAVTNPCYLGSVVDGPVSATNHGIHLDEPGSPTDYYVVHEMPGPFMLSELQVLGTTGDTLFILALLA